MSETKNEKQTTYKVKNKDGKQVAEEKIVKDKKTGEVKSHTIKDSDGKDISPKQEGMLNQNDPDLFNKSAIYQVGYLQAISKQLSILPNILRQLIEMNYYMAHLEPKEKRDSEGLKDHFEGLGISLN